MKKRLLFILSTLVFLLIGCSCKTEDPVASETSRNESGEYKNEFVEIVFDNDTFALLEEPSDDPSDYFLSLIPAEGEANSYPRIDVFSMDVSALTPESVAEMGEEAAKEDFGAFCESFLSMYYPKVVLDNGSSIEYQDAEITRIALELDVRSEKKSGYAEFIIAENPSFEMPMMHARVELEGSESNGVVKISFYPEFMPESEKEQMQEQMGQIHFLVY